MNLINFFKLTFLTTCLTWLAGCQQVTEQINPSGLTASNFFKTAADADVAINACYDAFQNPDRFILYGDGRSDVFKLTDRSTLAEQQVINGNLNSQNLYLSGWNDLYMVISRTNNILKNVPGITDPALSNRKDRILGEAYFLRAMAYFYLGRTFDNVPLILEPYQSLTQDFFPKQSTQQQVLQQVETDLKAAESLLTDRPFTNTIEFKGRASLGAVRSAMADLYLWQKKYQAAADAAAQVINSPVAYRLVTGADFGSIFQTKNTAESIWELQFDNTFLEGNNNNLTNLFLPFGGTGYAGGNRYFTASDKLANAYVPADVRGAFAIRTTGPSPAPWRDPNQNYINKYQGTLANANATRFFDSNIIIYRLADVLLMRAEALNELGRSAEALPFLNQIRTRAGVSPVSAATQSELRLAIENERLLELSFEGKRYFELKRTGRYAAVTGNTDANWLRWPIPANELVLNTNLIQNPGY